MNIAELEDARRQVGPLNRVAPQSLIDHFDTVSKRGALMAVRRTLLTRELGVPDPVGRLYLGLNYLMETVNPLLGEIAQASLTEALRIQDEGGPSGEYTPHLAQFATNYDLKHGNLIAVRHLLVGAQMGNMTAVTEIMAKKGAELNSDAPSQIGDFSWEVIAEELMQDTKGDNSLRGIIDYLRSQQAGPAGVILPHQTRSTVITGVELGREALSLAINKLTPKSPRRIEPN